MAYQLRYTSVPAGLKPGTSGYTTAQHTQGMSDELVTALESVSGYDHLAVRDPSFPANPSIYRYQILQLNAGTFFVLSILQDSGADHTGRTNYLAQHLVFESYELNVLQQNPEINPASILRLSPDNVLWHQPGPVTAQYLPPLEINDLIGQLKAKGSEVSIEDGASIWRQCHLRTEQAPGLLEGGLQTKCCLSYPPGSEAHLLALFAETLRIAIEKPNESTGQDRSPQEAWRYTFNVFVQPGESHQDYVWCGLCGPALQEAAGQQVYDIFGGQLPDATDERLLSFAETGAEPYVAPPEPVVPEQPQISPAADQRTPAAPASGKPGIPGAPPMAGKPGAPVTPGAPLSGTPGGVPNRPVVAGAKKGWNYQEAAGAAPGAAAAAQMGTAAEAAQFQSQINANVVMKKAKRKRMLMAACIVLIPLLTFTGLYFGGVIGGGDKGPSQKDNKGGGKGSILFASNTNKQSGGMDPSLMSGNGSGDPVVGMDPSMMGSSGGDPVVGESTEKLIIEITKSPTPKTLQDQINKVFGDTNTVCHLYGQDKSGDLPLTAQGHLKVLMDAAIDGEQVLSPLGRHVLLPVDYTLKYWEGKIENFKSTDLIDTKGKLGLQGKFYPTIDPLARRCRTLYLRGNNKFDTVSNKSAVWIQYDRDIKGSGQLRINQGGDEPDKPTLIIQVEKAGQPAHRYIIMDLSKGEKISFADSLVRGKTPDNKVTIKMDKILSSRLGKIKLVNGTELGPQLKQLNFNAKGKTYSFHGMTGINSIFSPGELTDIQWRQALSLNHQDIMALKIRKRNDQANWSNPVPLPFSGGAPISMPKGMKWVITYEFSVPPNLMRAKELQLQGAGGLSLNGNAGIVGFLDNTAIHRPGKNPQPGESFLTINAKQMKDLKKNPKIQFTYFISHNGNPMALKTFFTRLKPNKIGQFVVPQDMAISATRGGEFDPTPYDRDIKNAEKTNNDNNVKIQKAKEGLAKAAAQANILNAYGLFEFTVRK